MACTSNENNLNETLDCWFSQRYAQLLEKDLDFLEKGLGLVSPPCFVYDISKKIPIILYCTSWNIGWLNVIDSDGHHKLSQNY